MAQSHDYGIHFRLVRLLLRLFRLGFLRLFRGGGRRSLLLCRCRTCGQNPRQEKGGAAAEKDPVIRDAHEWSLF